VKLQDYRDTFYEYSGKASDLSRQLAFAGIALIWLFKKDTISGPSIPHELLLPGIFIVLALALDMFHYCLGSLIWRRFYRKKEEAGADEERELDHSVWLESPIYAVFILKIIFVFLAYGWIFSYFLRTLLFR
jgi:hypothetical protein